MTIQVPDPYIPPLKFGLVQPDLYRGAYPREINFPFLETLLISTIISLTPDPISETTDPCLFEFAHRNNITLVHLECAKLGKGKKRGVPLGYTEVLQAVELVIHKKNAPVYIHCLNGGQITSLFVACLRKLQFWSSIAIFNEFINFTTSITLNDRSFVESFNGEIRVVESERVDWLWAGMNRGVVGNHPHIRVIEAGQTEGEQRID